MVLGLPNGGGSPGCATVTRTLRRSFQVAAEEELDDEELPPQAASADARSSAAAACFTGRIMGTGAD